MKMRELWLLLAAVIVLSGFYLWRRGADSGSWSGSDPARQSHVLPVDFSSDRVHALQMKQGDRVVTLVRTGQGWGVQERDGYRADINSLRTLFVDLCETRVAQELTLNEGQTHELELADGAAVELRLLGKEGQELQRLLFGKKHESESEMPANPFMGVGGGSVPVGRYLQLQDGRQVLVSNTFSRIDDKVTDWMDREFFRISDMRRAELRVGAQVEWEVSRGERTADLSLAGAVPDGKELDTVKLNGLKNAFSWIRYKDVATKAEAAGLAEAFAVGRQLTVEDFDGFVHAIRIAAPVAGKQYVQVEVSWQGVAVRVAAADEKAEDKEKLETDFAKSVKEKQDKAQELNDRLAGWVYELEKSTVDAFAFSREALFKEKAPGPAAADAVPAP